jgi:hypothetical protein
MFRVASADAAAAASCSACAFASWRYCGIANRVRGALAFLSGSVAIQASTAGLNSARNRLR